MPFLTDAEWGAGNREVSAKLDTLLDSTVSLWKKRCGLDGHAFADGGSSAAKYLNLPDQWSWNGAVSYKWAVVLDRLASKMSEGHWSEP